MLPFGYNSSPRAPPLPGRQRLRVEEGEGIVAREKKGRKNPVSLLSRNSAWLTPLASTWSFLPWRGVSAIALLARLLVPVF